MGGALLAAPWTFGACGRWSDELACGRDDCTFAKAEWQRLESLSDKDWGDPPPDVSNRVLPIDFTTGALKDAVHPEDDPAVRFGWLLYYDPRLSGTATWIDTLGRPSPSARAPEGQPINVSCATCHDPARAGSDFTSVPGHVSVGAGWYDVNIQQTLNVAYYPILYWNGRADSVWAQAAQVMESPVSMNGDRARTACVIRNGHDRESSYLARYEAIFGAGSFPTATVDKLPADCSATRSSASYKALTPTEQQQITQVHVNAAKAIAAYEWVLRSQGSAFDRFVKEGPASTALSASARRGAKLFVGRASCVDCHSSPLFSDGAFHDIGIAQVGAGVPTIEACSDPVNVTRCVCTSGDPAVEATCLPWGAYAGLRRLASVSPDADYRRDSTFADGEMTAEGKALRCIRQEDREICAGSTLVDASFKGRWRTPSLRDVALTGPYMHDGSLATLEDVVWHYDQGVLAPLPEAPFLVPAPSEGQGGAGGGGLVGGASGLGGASGSGGGAAGDADLGAGVGPGQPAPELHPLHLTERDRADLVAFLRSLTGQPRFPVLHTCPPMAVAPCKTNPVTTDRHGATSSTATGGAGGNAGNGGQAGNAGGQGGSSSPHDAGMSPDGPGPSLDAAEGTP